MVTILLIPFTITLGCVYHGRAQKRVRIDPVQFLDAASGEAIQELVVIPCYWSFNGVGVPPEGPSRGKRQLYLANPFIYRAGMPFSPNQPESTGVFWGPWLYTGKAVELAGVVVFAPGYRRKWFKDFWSAPSPDRRLQLSPVSRQESLWEMQTVLAIIQKDKLKTPEECSFWEQPSCDIKVKFNSVERRLVRESIEQALKKLSQSP